MWIFNEAADSIVCPTKVAFGLEFKISTKSSLGTSDEGVIAEFILHSAEQDAARVHVWLGDEAVFQ